MRRPSGSQVACALRWAALAVAAAFVVAGVVAGEHLEVFWKAVTVCLECVGIA